MNPTQKQFSLNRAALMKQFPISFNPYLIMKFQSLIFVSIALAIGGLNASGQIAIGLGNYSQAFNTLASSGTANTWSDNATLPGWYAAQGGTSTGIATYRASAGSDSTGAIYSFGSSSGFGSAPTSERGLGSLPSNATGAIAYGVRFTNSTASAVTQFAVSYTGEQWRGSGGGTPQSLAFAYRIASGPLVNPESGTSVNWVSVPALDFTSPNLVTSGLMDGNLTTNRQRFEGIMISGINVLPGQELFLRWLDVNDSGNDHGLAVDDLTVFFPTNARPQIVAQPQSRTNLVGSTAVFTVNALGEAIAYQWRRYGTNLSDIGRFGGVTTETLTITNVQTSDAGNFTVLLTNSGGAVTSAVAVLTVPSGPAFFTQPTNQTVIAGADVTFTSQASGSAPLQYQWLFNEVPLPQRTTSFLTLTNVQAGAAGNYRVVVTNLGGATTSQVATLTVVPAAPWIVQQPVSEGVLLGANKRFLAGGRGTEPLFYQWQRDNTNLPGATDAALILTNVTEVGMGSFYRAVITNSLGSTNTVPATYGLVSLVAWGVNSSGQTDIPIAATNVAALAAGFSANAGLTTSGQAVTWGDINYIDEEQLKPPPSATNLVSVAVSYDHVLAARSNGTVVQWGNFPAPPANATNVVAVAASWGRSLALRANGTVVTWEGTSPGEAGVLASLTDVKAIAAGSYHQLALRSNGTVVAWGFNNYGQTNVPAGLNSVRAIAAGAYHSLALRSNGTVVAWGYDGGWGLTNVPSSATNIAAIAAGEDFNLALRSNGTLLTWSAPGSGMNPPAGTSNILAIAAGYYHALALIGPPLRIDPAPENFAVTCSNAQLRLTGLAGTGPVRIEASTNLVNWNGVVTNAPATAVLRLTVPVTSNAPAQFFRATEKR